MDGCTALHLAPIAANSCCHSFDSGGDFDATNERKDIVTSTDEREQRELDNDTRQTDKAY